ncbi:hypothetical protein XarbCFBP7408_04595 [Xanthomonas arboricola pv. guizotiae]|nr:hypothetical protein XarbCFBP7408_04595 [Xanthomonas arboricola pv. guizotiae]
MTIAGQQNGLTVELTVRTGGRIETLPFTIETKPVFDGKTLPWKACFMRLSEHQRVSRFLTVKAVTNRSNILNAHRHSTAQSQA